MQNLAHRDVIKMQISRQWLLRQITHIRDLKQLRVVAYQQISPTMPRKKLLGELCYKPQ